MVFTVYIWIREKVFVSIVLSCTGNHYRAHERRGKRIGGWEVNRMAGVYNKSP